MRVWMLQYFVYGGTETIGIFSSEAKAKEVIEKNGWSNDANYDISEWELDKVDDFYS